MKNMLLGLAAIPFLGACQFTYQERDWSTYAGPGAEHFQQEEYALPVDLIDDPLEPINRSISAFNYGVIYVVFQPLAWLYETVVPEEGRKGLGNVFSNLLYPGRLANNLLQGKWEGATRETKRFVLNSTVGIGGIFDPAKTHWKFKASDEDMGQTFHKWGWRDSTYFVLPFFGPSTVRDGLGEIGDQALDPLTYAGQPTGTYAQGLRTFNLGAPFVSTLIKFVEQTYDPYQLSKMLFVINREVQTEDYSHESEDNGETETLESVFFAGRDPNFVGRGETHTIDLANGKRVTYTAWMQPDAANCVFFVPGTGGHRLGGSALAVAETAFSDGNSVVTISSALNFEFIDETLTGELPGFLPSDSHDTHVAMDAIYRDLTSTTPDCISSSTLVGLSLGAMSTLYIAAAEEDPASTLMPFDLYLAINCPVSLEHATGQLDSFYNTPLDFPVEQRDDEVLGLFRKILDLGTEGNFVPGEPLPFVEWEARFLIGFSFRLTSADVIFQTQAIQDMDVLLTESRNNQRNMSYREASTFSFMEYMYAFVLPRYASVREDINFDEPGARRLFELCDIRSIETQLRKNKRVLYISNRNDPLLRPEDIAWAERTFGARATIFERGGHLGNLGQEDVREAIAEAARRAAEEVGLEL